LMKLTPALLRGFPFKTLIFGRFCNNRHSSEKDKQNQNSLSMGSRFRAKWLGYMVYPLSGYFIGPIFLKAQ